MALGRRGRRVDDHPLCRGCGFDLYGLPGERDECPECGRKLVDVRIGHRRKRNGFLVSGLLLAALGGGVLGLAVWGEVQQVGWQRVKPYGWLRTELAVGSTAMADAAMEELRRRMDAGMLDAEQVAGLVEEALELQADRSRPWNPEWGDFVQIVHAKGLVSDSHWEQYAREALEGAFVLEVRPRVAKGERFAYRISKQSARVGHSLPGTSLWVESDTQKSRWAA